MLIILSVFGLHKLCLLFTVVILLHQLDVRQRPRLVKIRLRRGVEAEVSEPAFAGQSLDPVLRRLALGCYGPEIQVHRAISVCNDVVARGAVRIAAGVNQAATFVVINRERPELRDGCIVRDVQRVILAAVEPRAGTVFLRFKIDLPGLPRCAPSCLRSHPPPRRTTTHAHQVACSSASPGSSR